VTLVLLIVIGLSLLATIDALISRRKVTRDIAEARSRLPVDEETGLLNHRAYLQRTTGELKRAKRSKGNLWLGVWTVTEGDPDRFGRVAADGLRFPEVGFRLSERVFCFTRPEITEQLRRDLHSRLRTAAPREKVSIGEVLWNGGEPDAMKLLDEAVARVK
jgi:hypothetical protein